MPDEPVDVLTPHDYPPADEPRTPATKMLADLELDLFGPDPVLVRGKVERGSGSQYQALSPEDRAHFDAVEKLVEAEAKLEQAEAAVGQAKNDLEAQKLAVDAAVDHAEKAREAAAARADAQAKALARRQHAVA